MGKHLPIYHIYIISQLGFVTTPRLASEMGKECVHPLNWGEKDAFRILMSWQTCALMMQSNRRMYFTRESLLRDHLFWCDEEKGQQKILLPLYPVIQWKRFCYKLCQDYDLNPLCPKVEFTFISYREDTYLCNNCIMHILLYIYINLLW